MFFHTSYSQDMFCFKAELGCFFKNDKCFQQDNAQSYTTYVNKCSSLGRAYLVFWNNPNMKAFSLNLGTIQKIFLAE